MSLKVFFSFFRELFSNSDATSSKRFTGFWGFIITLIITPIIYVLLATHGIPFAIIELYIKWSKIALMTSGTLLGIGVLEKLTKKS